MRRTIAAVLAVLALSRASAQEQRDDHDDHHHGHLHFTHPLITESPSPDTKLRVDQLWYRAGDDSAAADGRLVRVELERALAPWASLSFTVPYEWRTSPLPLRAHGFGSAELSLKAVTFAAAQRGLLFGGGVSASLPTGSDVNDIGSAHQVELEPFAHAAWMGRDVELVGMTSFSTATRLRAGEAAVRELRFNGSALYHVGEHAQLLLEIESVSTLAGPRTTVLSLAPGVELVPLQHRPLMLGVSLAPNVSGAPGARRVLASAFYHF